MVRRAIFLDRDGVLNRSLMRNGKPYAPTSLGDLVLMPGVEQALLRLRRAGFVNIVITNQPDVSTGRLQLQTLDAMHSSLSSVLALDAIRFCPHTDAAGCSCRKPAPGLLIEAAREFDVNLSTSYMIGDRWRDVEAGQRAGCECFFLDYEYAEKRPTPPFISVASLADAADIILSAPKMIDPVNITRTPHD